MRFILTSIALVIGSQAPAFAEGSAALAAHNALHEVEHLVEAGKADAGFVSSLRSVRLEKLQEAGKAFRSTLEQYPGADGKVSVAEVDLDVEGDAIGHRVLVAGAPAGAPSWPDASSITLLEEAFHQLLRHGTKPMYKPFHDDLSKVTLSQKKEGGQIVALADVESTSSPKRLRIVLSVAGKVQGASLID